MGLSTNSSVSHRRGSKSDMHVSLLEARLLKTKEFSASSETNSSHSGDFLHSGQDGTADARKHLDRKSTRLNSSHANISYAVSCLKQALGIPHDEMARSCLYTVRLAPPALRGD